MKFDIREGLKREITDFKRNGTDITFKEAVAMRSGAQFCSRWINGIADSKPTKDMEVRLLCCLCVLWR